jgi:GNAT superfamily N-acetyltransferase
MISFLEKNIASLADAAMCGFLNIGQIRHQLPSDSRETLAEYVEQCASLTPEEFYSIPGELKGEGSEEKPASDRHLCWASPVLSAFPENNRAWVALFRCAEGWSAPTVFMLHAYMSASDIGYRRIAAQFNRLGWNAAFVHLPYHYSRRPRGYLNGELAITADLVRTAEGLRQGVVELRQLMRRLRARGCPAFGLWATSYGGWIGSLLSFVESDFRFIALMAPIVNVTHAIWESSAAIQIRAHLRGRGIDRKLVERHFHLTSPMHNVPLAHSDRIVLAAGMYDLVAQIRDIRAVHEIWRGSHFLEVPQGHFGYRMMPAMLAYLQRAGLFENPQDVKN